MLGRKLLLLGMVFVFGSIYEHNLMIKLTYERQRLELKKNKLIKEKNEVMKEFYQLSDPARIRAWAESQGMKDLALSHVVTLTVQNRVQEQAS